MFVDILFQRLAVFKHSHIEVVDKAKVRVEVFRRGKILVLGLVEPLLLKAGYAQRQQKQGVV